jgi:hypothetical protein
VEKHVAKAKPKSNAAVFRSLEAELTDLCRVEHQTAEAAAKAEAQIAKVKARIEAICNLANFPERLSFGGERLSFGEHFIGLLNKRWRSSGDSNDYVRERDRLLVRLGEVSAEKPKRALEEARRQRVASKVNRNKQMAREFVEQRRLASKTSVSALKAKIGKRHNLGRSASIEAIDRGLKDLKT